MTTRTWSGPALGRHPSVLAPRPTGRRPKSRRRLRVEALEDRTVPADAHLTLELRPPAGASSPAPITLYPDSFTFGAHNSATIGSG